MFIVEDRFSQELFDFIHKPTVIALAWTFRFASLRFKDRYWNIMLMTFYLSVFYLPTLKQVVGQYKIWNEVMFWFTRMICYNVYIPLLMRQINDVEENPGPTIFDVINPMRTVSANYSQGNEALFGENAGKQCVTI